MSTLLWLAIWLGFLLSLGFYAIPLPIATVAILGTLLLTTIFGPFGLFTLSLFWLIAGSTLFIFNDPKTRKRLVIEPLYKILAKNLPKISETEQTALNAGTIGFEGDLFTGKPRLDTLLAYKTATLSEEEIAYLNGPVETLCHMTSDWEITHELNDLPPAIWTFLKQEGFFSLGIPKNYGGKGFSAAAHSEILAKLAGRSLTLASTVAVPNSLGPAELLLHYGTEEQKNYLLPRLASGQEIPCFALTSPIAGSDASAITDNGIVTKAIFDGEEIIGLKLNWDKRYITLAPIATLLGLAFKLYDPEGLIGPTPYLGITCALIPTHLPGITIGRRHLALNIPFQNGPTQGKDVFVPLDAIIGGIKMAGHGWQMLVESLSCGRAISLPSAAAGGMKVAFQSTTAYSRIRRQFKNPLANFEGIQEAIAQIAGFSYISEATRLHTASCIDQNEKPAIPGAIAKYHVTEMGRKVANLAMDVHGGKGIMLGPRNYLARAYQGAPIGITVEGANILTRNMIIFGQGAVRCHPYVLQELAAISAQDLLLFDDLVNKHIHYTLGNACTSMIYGFAAPFRCSFWQQISRASASFALVSDVSMAILGGRLKFKENLSARLGDMLSMMYLASCVLKRFHDQNSPSEDLPLVTWCIDYCMGQYWQAMGELLRNFPLKFVGYGLKLFVMPFGRPPACPSDKTLRAAARSVTQPSKTRDRLLDKLYIGDMLKTAEQAFKQTCALEEAEVYKRLSAAETGSPTNFETRCAEALAHKMITETEATELLATHELCLTVIAVDDFAKLAGTALA